MTAVVVDASVVIKWVLPEVHSDAARRLLGKRRELFAPDLLWAELGNALWKRYMAGEISADEVREIVADLRRFPIASLPVSGLVQAAVDIAVYSGRSVYDSLYLALATAKRCPLVTADRRLYNSLRGGALATTLLWVEDIGKTARGA